MRYLINSKSTFKDGLIIIEGSLPKERIVWTAVSERGFIKTVKAIALSSRPDKLTNHDIETYQGCLDYIKSDILHCEIIRFDQVTPLFIQNRPELVGALKELTWIIES